MKHHKRACLQYLLQLLEQHDPETAKHSIRLAFLARNFGRFLGLSALENRNLSWGACLHDIGKVGIPKSVINKPGRLAPEEWQMMREHTTVGEEMCQPFPLLRGVLPIVRYHHERWNGSGYPDGLAGEEIPFLVRVFQIADIYDALVSDRAYKASLSINRTFEILQAETDRGWHDPEIARKFFTFVRLQCSTGRAASNACVPPPDYPCWKSTSAPEPAYNAI